VMAIDDIEIMLCGVDGMTGGTGVFPEGKKLLCVDRGTYVGPCGVSFTVV
jgi:hypothetical protein